MQLSPQGLDLLKSFEGLSLKAYPDGGGWSIGYGHHGVKEGDVITREQADRLLAQDVARFEFAVSAAVPVATQNQFDAMTSLAYNVGTGAFTGSTLVQRHNVGDYQGAADEFLRWNKSQGKVHPGLVARRSKERDVYLYGFSPYTTPNVSPVEPAIAAPSSTQPEHNPASMVVAGAGLLFFCHSCGARSRDVGVELVEREV